MFFVVFRKTRLSKTRLSKSVLFTADEESLLDFLDLRRAANFNQCNQINLRDGLLKDNN